VNLAEIEKNVTELDLDKGFDLIYDLLLAYDLPKSGVTLLQKGSRDLSDNANEHLWKDRVFYRFVKDDEADLHSLIDAARNDGKVKRAHPRFLIVQDGKRLLALDARTETTLDILLTDLPAHSAFFMPWAGVEKTQLESLNYADVKAAEKMARLYDEIAGHNAIHDEQDVRNLNVFFSRLLFCFFAEDTRVFDEGSFTDAIASLTQPDGTDTSPFLDQLFEVLDTDPADRAGVPSHFRAFGYVNGRLFAQRSSAPRFSAKARRILLECGTLDWSVINPDIFGSMIQAVVRPSQREGLGMHYTSVENIMKVIRPLFLDDLLAQFDRADTVAKLQRLLDHICDIKVFDPACGSGNFLIIAFKELRKLEHRILQQMGDLDPNAVGMFKLSGIKLDHFYGIEIDDFAHEIAILSLWLTKHQMNVEFLELFGVEIALIPLRDTGNITCGNAARLDWELVCPPNGRVYILGNPPYRGGKLQIPEQKQDFVDFFGTEKYSRNMDYISIWFILGARYVSRNNAELGFVSTNSITQGDHVGLLWPELLDQGVSISFAHKSFLWDNQARNRAGVMCIVVGLSMRPPTLRALYDGARERLVSNISPYLRPVNTNTIVHSENQSRNGLPTIQQGSRSSDEGFLTLTPLEREAILSESPEAVELIKRYLGSREFLHNIDRYCLWIEDDKVALARSIPMIERRLDALEARRRLGGHSAQQVSHTPHRFGHRSHQNKPSIIVPRTSSERRQYIPMGFLGADTVISDAAFVIYGAETWVFGLLHSKMHMAWVDTVAGRMKSDYRYSGKLVYNSFPVPATTKQTRDSVASAALDVLTTRERFSAQTYEELYDPDKMPIALLEAHRCLDETVDRLYRKRAFSSDDERAAMLFSMYDDRVAKQKEAN